MRTKTISSTLHVLPIWGAMVIAALGAELQMHALSGDPAPSTQKIFYFSRQNNSHHRPASFLSSVRQDFGERGIQFTTSTNRNDLNIENLNQYDGTFFFGNHDAFSAAQTSALETYLQEGGGMVGMHVISYVARSNATLARILGGAFRGHHAISPFTAQLIQDPNNLPQNLANHPNYPFQGDETYAVDLNHPILNGLGTYTSPDEPYLHQNMNPDITLLSFREDHGGWDEPYTWVRNEGSGRVFYHANGHDARTWSQPNFRELMIRGARWASRVPEQSYTEFFPPLIGPSGEIQYLALVQTSAGAQLALNSDGEQTAMNGFQVPGNDESLSYLLTSGTRHTVLTNSRVALTTKIQSGTDEISSLFIGHHRYPELIASEGGSADLLEAGFTFRTGQNFEFVTDEDQTVVFSAIIEDSAGGNQKRVIALHDGQSASPVLIEGDPVGDNPAVIVSSIPHHLPSLSANGNLAVIAEVQTDQAPPELMILSGNPNELHAQFPVGSFEGELPEGSQISGLTQAIFSAQDELVFSCKLVGTGIDENNDQLIAIASEDGEGLVIFQEGLILGDQVITVPPEHDQLLPRKKDVLIIGNWGDDLALISCRGNRAPVILARENQVLQIENQEYRIKELDPSSLAAESNQAVMKATLQITEGGTEIVALLQIGSGVIRPLLLEGQEITTADGPFSIAEIQIRPSSSHGSGLRENEVRLALSSTEGKSAIVGISNIDDLDQDGVSDTLANAFSGSFSGGNSFNSKGYPKISSSIDGEIHLDYWHPVDPGPGLEYTIEASNDLINWVQISAEIMPAINQSDLPVGMQRMIARVPDDEEHQFFRFSF